ncbi:MAG: hypothetical protein WEC75_12210 [Dehalococcoidia bacterium]
MSNEGKVVSTRKYWPFGAEREISGDGRATDRWYTGQKEEDFDGLGLYNYRARMYSTLTGRLHQTLGGETPPMAAGVTDRIWSLEEIAGLLGDRPVTADLS